MGKSAIRASTRNTERQAQALLARHKLNQKLPIDVEALAKAMGITIRYEPFDEELSGVLVKEGDRVAIGVNSAHSITRQRFTIAHEIGHFALNHDGNLFVDQALRSQAYIVHRDGKSSLGTDYHEVQANQFAAELLMPQDLLNLQIEKRLDKRARSSSADLISELARVFVVSTQAMEYRLANLGNLIPS